MYISGHLESLLISQSDRAGTQLEDRAKSCHHLKEIAEKKVPMARSSGIIEIKVFFLKRCLIKKKLHCHGDAHNEICMPGYKLHLLEPQTCIYVLSCVFIRSTLDLDQ